MQAIIMQRLKPCPELALMAVALLCGAVGAAASEAASVPIQLRMEMWAEAVERGALALRPVGRSVNGSSGLYDGVGLEEGPQLKLAATFERAVFFNGTLFAAGAVSSSQLEQLASPGAALAPLAPAVTAAQVDWRR